ncbi:hypothetical protein FA15DRAFT_608326 [Coprinopsis marcescibilis]|uniref:Chromatin remodeling factor mit1 n=1 Tax=Coprinopsis marcescibilis TaxID=230819 RepID=A0A5C3LCN2_COPMA|nr:hypothetical protein FA15DRAFT_608326 [Coprinopsis marcescibilis]
MAEELESIFTGSSLTPLRSDSLDLDRHQSPEKIGRAPRGKQRFKPSNRLYILPPTLSSSTKALYKSAEEAGLKLEMEIALDEVVGDYTEDGVHYYFARYQGGISHKFRADVFTKRYPALVSTYKKARQTGQYDKFDPSDHTVHPLSRVKTKLNILKGGGKARLSISSARSIQSDGSVQYVPDSEEEAAGDSDSFNGRSVGPRRLTRQRNQLTLPFSPKKTRSQAVNAIESDSGSEFARPSRRSARRKRPFKVTIGSESNYEPEDNEEEEGSDYKSVRPATKKNATKVKVPIPSYGHIRDIKTIDIDPFPDDEYNKSLRGHRSVCEKCHLKPADHLLQNLARRAKRENGKKRRRSEDEFEVSDGERYNDLGGWVQCLKCPVSVHWGCLAATQQAEILKAARHKEKSEWEAKGGNPDAFIRRSSLDTNEVTEFVCAACTRGGNCIGCMEDVGKHTQPESRMDSNGDVEMADGTNPETKLDLARTLLFRCFTCKRPSHYEHLPTPQQHPDFETPEVAEYYQDRGWLCGDCVSFRYPLDKILAWRPYPLNAPATEFPSYKDSLQREYLVKWTGRSYRRLTWVPHMWLLSTNQAKLKNFLAGGAKVDMLKELPVEGDEDKGGSEMFQIGAESREPSNKPNKLATYGPLDALPDAEKRIPPAWTTVDRVLDVVFWDKPDSVKSRKKGKRRATYIASEDEEMMETGEDEPVEVTTIFETGELSDDIPQMKASEYEKVIKNITEDDIDRVVYAFIKWDDLGYEEATWDSPPRKGEHGYDAFVKAFKRFVASRTVFVPKKTGSQQKKIDDRSEDGFGDYVLKDPAGLELGQDPNLKLMPFQVDGFNWLCDNWWRHQTSILADDMGLGKTVQMAAFLGTIAQKFQAFPALVVVPNSTITNWVREFERWAPNLRVVPFYGERKARDILKEFELFHKKPPSGYTDAKFHVLVTTYEGIINPKDFSAVFKHQPRWEVLVVDEGQRLKSDSSLLFRKLNELNSGHRVIMTGTPLNNNIRELFNLMNFLDPENWQDLEAMEKEYEHLTEELIKELHDKLRPYFLRRIKSEVLQLPPKNEVIVPVTMAPLQRQVYRSILSHNADLLKALTQPTKVNSVAKGRLNNVLMHLRKCLQHPYLYSEDIEPRGIPPSEVHEKLVDASAKLRFLKALLPKLKARGHRVLLFSQFVLALDIVEDFLNGEGFKFLRLDGNTKGTERQKSMDEFNKPGSEYFIFLLTTRAGGVGINLFTTDTVIIFDPDFNPHQDLQAIARAYRYGQKNTCLVFKLMVKNSAEERIMQIGKKKLVLDHLIVQKMDDDENSPGENVESILTYGAQALFDQDNDAKDIVYTDQEIDSLIEKTEKEGDGSEGPREGGLAFSFAKVWASNKNDLEDVGDDDQVDSWAKTLQNINKEKQREMIVDQAVSGRGARRRAADAANTKLTVQDSFNGESPAKRTASSASDLDFQDRESSVESGTASRFSDNSEDEDFRATEEKPNRRKGKSQMDEIMRSFELENIEPSRVEMIDCGLCGGRHGTKQCLMTDSSQNLAEYRLMLIMHADDEPWEERSAAVSAIDELLNSRGQLHLIRGQPLHPIPKQTAHPPTKKPKEAADVAKQYLQKQRLGKSRPSLAPYDDSGPPTEVVRSFMKNGQSNSVAGPSTQRSTQPLASSTGQPTSTATPQPVAGSSKSTGTVAARFRQIETAASSSSRTNPVAGPLTSVDGPCLICGQSPMHFVKQCPLITRDPSRIPEIIQIFERSGDPSKLDVTHVLKRLYKKYQKQ